MIESKDISVVVQGAIDPENTRLYKADYDKLCSKKISHSDGIKISIIIPIFNAANYLEKCLYSVTSQTLTDIEIICVDDGSSDNSLDVIKSFQKYDSRIILLCNEQNSGQSYSRNKGIEIARGEYIGFIDSDDWIDSNYFEELYKAALLHEADIVHCSLKMVYPHNDIREWHYHNGMKFLDSSKKQFNPLRMIYASGVVFNKIYKKKLITDNKIKFIEGIYWEDNPFVMETSLNANKIIFVTGIYYYYLQREGSTIYSKSKKLHLDFYTSAKYILEYLNANTHSFSKKNYVEFIDVLTDRMNTQIRNAIRDNSFDSDTLKDYIGSLEMLKNDFKYVSAAQKVGIEKEVRKCKKHFLNFIKQYRNVIKWAFEPFSMAFYVAIIMFKVAIFGVKEGYRLLLRGIISDGDAPK